MKNEIVSFKKKFDKKKKYLWFSMFNLSGLYYPSPVKLTLNRVIYEEPIYEDKHGDICIKKNEIGEICSKVYG